MYFVPKQSELLLLNFSLISLAIFYDIYVNQNTVFYAKQINIFIDHYYYKCFFLNLFKLKSIFTIICFVIESQGARNLDRVRLCTFVVSSQPTKIGETDRDITSQCYIQRIFPSTLDCFINSTFMYEFHPFHFFHFILEKNVIIHQNCVADMCPDSVQIKLEF